MFEQILQIKYMNILFIYLQSGVVRHFPLNIHCGVNIKPYSFYVYEYQRNPQSLTEVCRKKPICAVFMVENTREI